MKTYIKWQQVVLPQSYAIVLQQKKSSENRHQEEKNKNNDDGNRKKSIKLIIFSKSITKLIVLHQIIKYNGNEAINFSQSGVKVKVENIKIQNDIQRVSPEDSSRKICKLLQNVKCGKVKHELRVQIHELRVQIHE